MPFDEDTFCTYQCLEEFWGFASVLRCCVWSTSIQDFLYLVLLVSSYDSNAVKHVCIVSSLYAQYFKIAHLETQVVVVNLFHLTLNTAPCNYGDLGGDTLGRSLYVLHVCTSR